MKNTNTKLVKMLLIAIIVLSVSSELFAQGNTFKNIFGLNNIS
ncbi:MAG: hypothetical protein WC868_12455 [Bacteroidales bacterium]